MKHTVKDRKIMNVAFGVSGLAITILLLLTGCSTNWAKSLGSYTQDAEITQSFKNYRYNNDYNYFYTGKVKSPEAIIGIQKGYELVKVSGWANTTNWKSFEPSDGEKLQKLVNGMGKSRRLYGAYIKVPGGESIGVMYTKKWGGSYSPYIRLLDNNRLEVVPHKYNSHWAPP